MALPRRFKPQRLDRLEEVVLPGCSYAEQIVQATVALFNDDPSATKQLVAIDLMALTKLGTDRTEENKLHSLFKDAGYSFQIVRFGGKTGQDIGVLVTKD
ncbi:hypothetical protein LUCX_153 [Xanthomonas phage vB_XciM_LucasX]|nr:hypothetical protein LUCX_153 [Xanthomonas phage vB_XciM_LucasX]